MRYPKKTYGNISLSSGISWWLAAPRPPNGFPRVLGPKKKLEKIILMIFRSFSRPHQEVYSYAIRSSIWSAVILEKSWIFFDPPKRHETMLKKYDLYKETVQNQFFNQHAPSRNAIHFFLTHSKRSAKAKAKQEAFFFDPLAARFFFPTRSQRRAKQEATPRGFEPLRAEPNGFLVHLLNHSDTVSLVRSLDITSCPTMHVRVCQNKKPMAGFEPTTSRLLSGCSTAKLHWLRGIV